MILDYLASKTVSSNDLVVVSPDVGGVARARAFAKKLSDAPLAIVDKRRHGHNVAEVITAVQLFLHFLSSPYILKYLNWFYYMLRSDAILFALNCYCSVPTGCFLPQITHGTDCFNNLLLRCG